MKKNGVTLAELLISLIVLGVMVGLAVPRFTQAFRRAKMGELVQASKSVYSAWNAYRISHRGKNPGSVSELDIDLNRFSSMTFAVATGNVGNTPTIPENNCSGGTPVPYAVLANFNTTTKLVDANDQIGVTPDGEIWCFSCNSNMCQYIGIDNYQVQP